MIILAIETSCDDTGIALVQVKGGDFKVLSSVISSQVKLHEKYGGVYPSLAKREHIKNLPLVLKSALTKAKNLKVDLVAVTSGPGLEPCLWAGINFAKDLAKKLSVPLLPINHIEAHILVNFLKNKIRDFPAISLIVSGGHTQLISMKDFGKYEILGETRDDAAGECFDKVARILGLGYPGGPEISKKAKQNTKFKINLPRPMLHQKNYDFSFSGLKTAVLYDFKNRKPRERTSKEYIGAMAAETQQAIIDVLIQKTIKAAKNKKAKTIILGGGVTANKELRKQLTNKITKELPKTKLLIPETELSTDNAVMIAVTAHYLTKKKKSWKNIKANANLRV